MCLGERGGIGGGQELPLAPTCAFADPRPKKVTGFEKTELRPQASRPLVKTKDQTLETGGFSFCSPRMDGEECGTTADKGHTHTRGVVGLWRILPVKEKQEGPGLGTQKMSL